MNAIANSFYEFAAILGIVVLLFVAGLKLKSLKRQVIYI